MKWAHQSEKDEDGSVKCLMVLLARAQGSEWVVHASCPSDRMTPSTDNGRKKQRTVEDGASEQHWPFLLPTLSGADLFSTLHAHVVIVSLHLVVL